MAGEIKNHYEILGISQNATATEIKKAYRGLAMKYHPDKNKDDDRAEAERIFKDDILPAYEILSDPRKKKEYDSHLTEPAQPKDYEREGMFFDGDALNRENLIKVAQGEITLNEIEEYNLYVFMKESYVNRNTKLILDSMYSINNPDNWKNMMWLMSYLNENFPEPEIKMNVWHLYTHMLALVRYNPSTLANYFNATDNNPEELNTQIKSMLYVLDNTLIPAEEFSKIIITFYNHLSPEKKSSFREPFLKELTFTYKGLAAPVMNILVRDSKITEFKKLLTDTELFDKTEFSNILKQLEKDVAAATEKKLPKLNTELAARLELLKSIEQLNKNNVNDSGHPSDQAKEFDQAFSQARSSLRIMATKILESPFGSVPAVEIKLVSDTAANLNKLYQDPTKANIDLVIANSKQINKKIGSFWHNIKSTLLGVIGVACIIVGALSLVPTFAASTTLIAIGSALCVAAGVPSFVNLPGNSKRETADKAVHNIDNLLNRAKAVRSIETPARQPELEQLVPFTPSSGNRR